MLASLVSSRVLRLKPRKVRLKGEEWTFAHLNLSFWLPRRGRRAPEWGKSIKDGKIAALLILSANERTNVFPPLTSLIALANMRLVQTIPL